MLALLERNAREVGFTYDLREHRVRKHRQELVGVERHHCGVSDMLERVRAACSQGLALSSELTVKGEGACRAELSRVVPGINHRGRRSVSNGVS